MSRKLTHIRNWSELAKQPNWSVASLTRLCEVFAAILRRHFVEYTGVSVKSRLAERRRLEAVHLLRQWLSIKEIPHYLGYRQQTNLSRAFKTRLGFRPSAPFALYVGCIKMMQYTQEMMRGLALQFNPNITRLTAQT
jgi:AraC-like DNA-binding protein